MTGFDFLVLLIVGVAAAGGFMRGFLQEILSVAAWILAVLAINTFHTQLTNWMMAQLGYGISTSIFAVAMLLLVPYAAMKVIANNVGTLSKNPVLGPIDRVLGFGFGALKGVIIAVIGFSVLVLGYDDQWGYSGRPTWITTARTYEFVDSASRALVPELAARRAAIREAAEARAAKRKAK